MLASGGRHHRNQDNDPRGPYVLSDVTAPFELPHLTYEWHGQRPPAGRCWRFTRERAEELDADGRIVFSPRGLPRLKRYLSEARILDAAVEEAAVPPRGSLELIVRTAMKFIAEAIAKSPQCLRDVEWRDLERVMREVFEGLGFDTRLTKSSGDGGFDLQLQCRDGEGASRTFLVEIKHWLVCGKKVGWTPVRHLIDVVAKAAQGTTGLLLSSSDFTVDVLKGRTELERLRVRVAGRSKIVSLCQSYIQREAGIWAPTSSLAELLLDGTI